ncbi:MAG: sulfite exporter TauE/SafE family protein [Pseudonocardia sp.]
MLPALLGLLVGMVIGALGGGGGVLTVPVLVYLLGESAQDATTSSVIIVGVTAAVGTVARLRAGLVRVRTGLALAAVGVPAAFAGTLVNQRVPEEALLLTFSALTLVAAAAMLVNTGAPAATSTDSDTPNDKDASGGTAGPSPRQAGVVVRIVASGAAVGFLTGFLGVGGGFLVVPALVLLLGVPMRWAIGTSLLVIAVNAVAATVARLGAPAPDWTLVVPFTAAAVAGTLIGARISARLSGRTLTRAFAVLLIIVGAGVAAGTLLPP